MTSKRFDNSGNLRHTATKQRPDVRRPFPITCKRRRHTSICVAPTAHPSRNITLRSTISAIAARRRSIRHVTPAHPRRVTPVARSHRKKQRCVARNGRAAAPARASGGGKCTTHRPRTRAHVRIPRVNPPALAASRRLHGSRKGMRSCVPATVAPRLHARPVAQASRARYFRTRNPSVCTRCARGAAQARG
jgi:hypothetical protein